MAKAFIDMFVQRFAKTLSVGVLLAVTAIFASFSTIRWLSLFNIAVVVLWIVAVRYAGNRFKEVTEPGSRKFFWLLSTGAVLYPNIVQNPATSTICDR